MTTTGIKEDVWIPSVCNMCFNGCGILVHRVDGVVVKIEGNPASPVGQGRICGKGAAGIMQLYDPNRITKPLKRTNPQKGLDQDPGWQEISWDEAYTIATEKIKEQLAVNPRSIMIYTSITNNANMMWFINLFASALGTQLNCSGQCGASIHAWYELFTGHGNGGPDYALSKYILQFGTQAGTATRHGFNMSVNRLADARARGCKLVNVDPHMSAGPEKADTWVPIRPGTDGMLAMSTAYVLVHELDIYDKEYLKRFTDATDLISTQTGMKVRDEEGKPYIWDMGDNCAKILQDETIKDKALLGTYTVNGEECRPAFQVYFEHIKKFTPEYASEVTTVPVAQIRQVAKEFGEAACIGQTITIEGKVYPYRPVCADCFSGITRHRNAFLSLWAVLHLNLLVGSCNIPGGLIGYGPICHSNPNPSAPQWEPTVYQPDQMLNAVMLHFPLPRSKYEEHRKPVKFRRDYDLNLLSLQPMNTGKDPFLTFMTQMNPEAYHQKAAEMQIIFAGNPYKNWGRFDEMEEYMKSFKYTIMCDIYLNDSSYFADLIMPEACYLERLDVMPNSAFIHHTPGSVGSPWAVQIRQPTVPARDNCPGSLEIFVELADRLGVLPKYQFMFNYMFMLKPENYIDVTKKHTAEELLDHVYKQWAGPDKGLEWFKKNGVYTWDRRADEVYVFPNIAARVPFYEEEIVDLKPKVKAITDAENIPWNFDSYSPLPDWVPCIDFKVRDEGYDLFPIYYTNAINVDTWGQTNPWINEMNEIEPYGYNIEINRAVAEQKGLKSGDLITLQAANGRSVEGKLILVEGIHPEVLAVGSGCWDNKSKFMPIGREKGTAVIDLLDVKNPDKYDYISAAYDQCVRVKIIKK